MWHRNNKQSAEVRAQLDHRVEDLEKYNQRLVELTGALTEKLKEFSDNEQHLTNGNGQRPA